MSKKNILSAVLATSLLLVSCGGRDDDYVAINNQGGMITPPNNSIPTPPSPQSPPQNQPQKPAESYMGSRSVARWKKEITPDIYFGAIDIADLIQNKGKFNIDFLKNYITIHSTEPDGSKYYEFQEEDFSKVEILDLEYSQNQITFYTKYNGYTSTIKSSLPFNELDFYNRQFTINSDYVSQNYMRGIYELVSGYLGNIFKYDTSRYDITVVSKNRLDSNNEFNIELEVTDKKANNKIITIYKTISGFKALSDLANNLSIIPINDFNEAVKSKIRNIKNKNKVDVTSDLKNIFLNQKWIQKTEIEIDNTVLSFDLKYDNQKDREVEILSKNGGVFLGVYIEPDFVLTSAIFQGSDLYITIQLRQANDVYVGKDYKVVVKNAR